MPPVATRFALPYDYEAEGVRRYGFHGLSYQYIARSLREIAPIWRPGASSSRISAMELASAPYRMGAASTPRWG